MDEVLAIALWALDEQIDRLQRARTTLQKRLGAVNQIELKAPPTEAKPRGKTNGNGTPSKAKTAKKPKKLRYYCSVRDIEGVITAVGTPLSAYAINQGLEAAGIRVSDDKLKQMLEKGLKVGALVNEGGKWGLSDE